MRLRLKACMLVSAEFWELTTTMPDSRSATARDRGGGTNLGGGVLQP